MAEDQKPSRADRIARIKAKYAEATAAQTADTPDVMPAATAAAGFAAGGGGKEPLRAPIFLNDYVTTPVKAAATAAGLGAMEAGSFALGAIPSAIGAAGRQFDSPVMEDFGKEYGIEGLREKAGVPSLRAYQQENIEDMGLPGRMGVAGLELAAGGAPLNRLAMAGMATGMVPGITDDAIRVLKESPAAIQKAAAVLDFSAGAAGEAAADVARMLGQSEGGQAATRAFSQLVTAMGGPLAVRTLKGIVLGAKDATVAKPVSRIKTDVGLELSRNRPRDPNVFDTARASSEEFRSRGLEPPPIGSLTDNPALVAEQDAAMRNIPGMSSREAQRQSRTDTALRSQMTAEAPIGIPQSVAFALEDSRVAAAAAATAERQRLDQQLMAALDDQAASRRAWNTLVSESGERLSEAVTTLVAKAEEAATAALSPLGTGISAREAGEVFVMELENARTAFRENSKQAYDAVLSNSQHRIGTEAIKVAAEAASIPNSTLTASAEKVPDVIAAIRDADVLTISARELVDVRSLLLKHFRESMNPSMPKEEDARRIGIVLDAIDDELDKLDDIVPGIREVNAWYRTGKRALYSGRFKDVGRELRSKGGQELDPSVLASRFLLSNATPGADEAMEAFSAAYGRMIGLEPQSGLPSGVPTTPPSTLAHRALDEHIVAQMRMAVTDPTTGVVNKKALSDWVAKHDVALSRRPELKAKLQSAAEAQMLADSDIARLNALRKQYEKDLAKAKADPSDTYLQEKVRSARSELDAHVKATDSAANAWEKAFGFAVRNPQGRIDEIVAASGFDALRRFEKLAKEVEGNENAKNGLAVAVWRSLVESVTDASPGGPMPSPLLNPQKFARLFEKNGPLIKRVFGPERRALLREFQRLSKMNTAAGSAKPAVENAETTGRIQRMISLLASRAWGLHTRVVGLPYVATEAALRLALGSKAGEINQAQAQKILEMALYDVDFYEDLIRLAKAPRNKQIAQRLATRIGVGRQATGMVLDNREVRTRQDLRAIAERRRAAAGR